MHGGATNSARRAEKTGTRPGRTGRVWMEGHVWFRRPPPRRSRVTHMEREEVSLSMEHGTCMRRVRGSREARDAG